MAATLAKGREFQVHEFIHLFIAALVLRGKKHIYVRRERSIEERRRMRALHKHLNDRVRETNSSDRSWLYSIVKLRNALSPGNHESFSGFYAEIADKQLTIVSIDWSFGEYYSLDLADCTARHYLNNAEPRLRALVEKAADVYMGAAK